MLILPAIDLCEGRCVRLYQGDYQQATEYAEDPCVVAQKYQQQGAKYIHLVDLSGAKDPQQRQIKLIERIVASTSLPIQVGGGIRRTDDIQALFDVGVDRVIVGSYAIQYPETVQRWLALFGPNRIVIALDCRQESDGQYYVATHGWQSVSKHQLFASVQMYSEHHLQHLLCTDIACDGTLTAPNFALYQQLKTQFPLLYIQASGGVSTLSDVQRLKQLNIAAVVIGKALYENKFTLTEVLAC